MWESLSTITSITIVMVIVFITVESGYGLGLISGRMMDTLRPNLLLAYALTLLGMLLGWGLA